MFKKAIGRENVTRERLLSVFKAVCFCPQSLDVSLRKMTLQLEELLLLKLLQFFGYVQQDDDIAGSNEEEDECLYATQRYFSPLFSQYINHRQRCCISCASGLYDVTTVVYDNG